LRLPGAKVAEGAFAKEKLNKEKGDFKTQMKSFCQPLDNIKSMPLPLPHERSV
jgi:hypothetical protein